MEKVDESKDQGLSCKAKKAHILKILKQKFGL